jgi:uncharacterized protein (DUF1800 family)
VQRTTVVDERVRCAWLARRAGFGPTAAELDAAEARGAAAELDRLLAPPDGGLGEWDDAQLPRDPFDGAARRHAIVRWFEIMATSTHPLHDRMAWLWHGHFVSSLDKVRVARTMVDQVRLLRAGGLGRFPDLVRAVTTDPAMLVYLDGRTSTAAAPNENHARELLELFTLGVGEYDEADVQAGAAALTGWRLEPGDLTARFVPGRHDDTPRRFLGVDGVHDVDSVVAAIAQHPALPTFVARTVATELLGAVGDDVVAALAARFTAEDLRIDALVRAALEAGLDGASAPVVVAPVPWVVAAQRATGTTLPVRTLLAGLRTAGQIPLVPPNVAGWPGGPAWFATSTVVARAGLAASVAAATADDHPTLVASDAGDLDALARALGLPEGFTAETAGALTAAGEPRDRLALALVSPELVVV